MFGFTIEEVIRAALIFLRIGGILFALPIFGDSPTPLRVRIILSLALSIALNPLIGVTWLTAVPNDAIAVSLLVGREMLVGLVIGYVARATFEGIVLAAGLVGFQMGFGTANLFLPDADTHVSSFAALHRTIMMLIFLGLSLHHVFIRAILDTFRLIPAGGAFPQGALAAHLINVTAAIFPIAIQLASPVLIALMFTMTALGLVARAVPQFNVFNLSFPVSFFVGLLIYAASLPFFPGWFESHFARDQANILNAIQGLVP